MRDQREDSTLIPATDSNQPTGRSGADKAPSLKRLSFSSSQLGLAGDIGRLSLSILLSRALLFARDILLAGVLGPVSYGVWVQLIVIFNYALHLPLGFQHAMSRDVPFFLGRKDYSRVATIQGVAWFVTIGTALLATSAVLLALLVFEYRLLGLSSFGIVIVLGVILAQQVNGYLSILLRAHQKFDVFATGFVVTAVLGLILSVSFSVVWGVIGAAGGLGLALLLASLYWVLQVPQIERGAIVLDDFKVIGRLALPLFMIGTAALLIVSVDRLVVIAVFDQAAIGYYGLAFMVSQAVVLVTTPLTQALHPRMMQSFGAHGDPGKIGRYLLVLSHGLGVGVAVLVGLGYLIVGPLVLRFLPDFAPATDVVRIILIASAVAAVANGANVFLVAINQQKRVLAIQVAVVTLQIVGIGSAVYLGGDITAIAWIMAFANVWYAAMSGAVAGTYMTGSIRRGLVVSSKGILLVGYMLMCLVAIGSLPTLHGAPVVDIGLRIALWGTIPLPALFHLYRAFQPALPVAARTANSFPAR